MSRLNWTAKCLGNCSLFLHNKKIGVAMVSWCRIPKGARHFFFLKKLIKSGNVMPKVFSENVNKWTRHIQFIAIWALGLNLNFGA